MRDKLINVKNCLVTCLIITMFSGIAYAGPNSSATCGLDMNFSTTDIEADIAASAGDIITVAVVAGGVSNLDTYQAEPKDRGFWPSSNSEYWKTIRAKSALQTCILWIRCRHRISSETRQAGMSTDSEKDLRGF